MVVANRNRREAGKQVEVFLAGLFNLNDTLRFNIYDSLAGADEMVLIDSVKIFEPLLHHNQNYIINGYAHRFAEYGTHFVTVVINPGHLIAECDFENNFSIYSILIRPVPPSKPDLVIHSEWIDLSELNPDYGDTFCITNVDVHNFGDTTAFDIEIKYEISGVQLGDIVVIDSIPKDGYFYTQPTECAVVDTCEPSLRIVRVCSDPFNLIEELIEDNNCATRSVFYCEAADLYVKDIFLVPSCNEVGQDVQIMAVIADSSEGDATYSALIDFYYLDGPQNNWRDTIYISTSGITDISAGTDSVTTYVNWTVALDSGYIYVDIADVYPNDYNPDNNTGSAYYACVPGCMYLAGDANMANEYVDIGNPLTGPWRVGGDVTFLVNYFDITSGNQPCLMHNPNNADSYPGGPVNGYYFASADATGEGLVTGGDVSRLVAYFGGTAEIKWYGWDKPDPENYYPPLWLNNRGSGLEQPVPPLEELPEGWPNCQAPPVGAARVLRSIHPGK